MTCGATRVLSQSKEHYGETDLFGIHWIEDGECLLNGGSMQFSVEYRGGLFLGETSGDAVANQFSDLFDAMLNHEEWQPGSRWMHDHSNLNAGPLTVDDIRSISHMCALRRDLFGAGKCALVVSRDLEFGLSRMWGVFVEDQWDVAAEVFRSRDDAIAWLNT